jgi:hypothetical protein
MMWPPSILRVRIASKGSRTISLWIPLFLLWPLIFVAAMVFPAVMRLSPKLREEAGIAPGLTSGLHLWMAFAATRGMRVDVQDKDSQVFVAFR